MRAAVAVSSLVVLVLLSSHAVSAPMYLAKADRVFLDRESMECLGCHDASLATDVTLQVCPEHNCDHPLGVDYRTLSFSNHGLKSVGSLPQPIKLVNNSTIGCATCHVPFKAKDHSILSSMRTLYPEIPDPMLVMDNRKSELCFGCHAK